MIICLSGPNSLRFKSFYIVGILWGLMILWFWSWAFDVFERADSSDNVFETLADEWTRCTNAFSCINMLRFDFFSKESTKLVPLQGNWGIVSEKEYKKKLKLKKLHFFMHTHNTTCSEKVDTNVLSAELLPCAPFFFISTIFKRV